MRARATQIQPLDGGPVAAPTRYGTHEQNLVESELSVVEALLGCFQLHLIRLHFQDTRNPRRQLAMPSRSDVLHMQFEPSVSSLDFDARRRVLRAGAPRLGYSIEPA